MKKFFYLPILLFFITGCITAAVKPKQENYMAKAVFDIDISVPSKEVTQKLYEIINVRSDSLQKSEGFMPAKLPEIPNAPNVQLQNVGMGFVSFTLPKVQCDNAYAIMTGFDKGVSSFGLGSSDQASYTGCIYPYEKAYRIYIIGTFMNSSGGGLEGMVAEGIKKGITGSTREMYGKWFGSILNKFKETFPTAKEIEISMP
ncbi:MAG: hypothetical protein HQK79_21980 [Desulfobacterales bacterium]|nr:hypothetical protein [Desulfobacterales bacterium]